MRVARFYGGHDIRVEDAPDPTPGAGEVLVRVGAAGVCGSDLHDYRAGPSLHRAYPYTGGHELAGTVAAVGTGVAALRVGDRVAIEPLHLLACGQCRWCRAGQPEVCPERGVASGVRRHSTGFAELDVAPERSCLPLPDDVALEAGAILDVYACAVHAAQRVPATPADTVAVIGTGPIGLAAIEMYRSLGVRQVVACGRRDEALEVARSLGADELVNVARDDVVGAIRGLTEGAGADVVIEAVGGASSDLSRALALLAPNGALGVLGLFDGLQALDLTEAMRRQVRIAWINSYGTWGGVREFEIALRMVCAGRFHPHTMITHRFPLEAIGDAFAAAADKGASGATKVIVMP